MKEIKKGLHLGKPATANYWSLQLSLEETVTNLEKADSHFEFGKNWTDFLNVVEEAHKANAVVGMRRLFPDDDLRGMTFLDVGCGSGLHSLATDIDGNSVSATRNTLAEVDGKTPWVAQCISVFDLPPERFDIVYSWGVLHHTGDMWRAIRTAAERVKPGGLFAVALYRKTPFCWAWRFEKAAYTAAPDWLRAPWRWGFMLVNLLAVAIVRRRNPYTWVREYKERRGMSFRHDINDWLGGYPYESAAAAEVDTFMQDRGFSRVRAFIKKSPAFGLFGSGCDEFVFRRQA